jgi:hypothetical protein
MKRHTCKLVALALSALVMVSPGCAPAATTQPPALSPDSAAASAPAVSAPAESEVVDEGGQTIGKDPVSGRNQQVDFGWEQYCYSSEYQLQIAKDPECTLIVLDTGAFAPASSMAPAAYFPAGGLAASPSSLTGWAGLEAGHTYYWRVRVRQAATGQYIRSPWSEVKSFTIEP